MRHARCEHYSKMGHTTEACFRKQMTVLKTIVQFKASPLNATLMINRKITINQFNNLIQHIAKKAPRF